MVCRISDWGVPAVLEFEKRDGPAGMDFARTSSQTRNFEHRAIAPAFGAWPDATSEDTGLYSMNRSGSAAIALLLAFTLGACDRPETEEGQDSTASDPSVSESAASTTASDAPASPDTATVSPNAAVDTPTPAGTADADFYRQALTSGAAEVALSEHAASTSSSEEVARIAEMLVKDHGELNSKLRIASGMSDGVPPPAEAKAAEEIKAKTGAAFDTAYLQKMSEGHKKSISLYETASTAASDAETRGLASAALPKLREHAGHVYKALAAQPKTP